MRLPFPERVTTLPLLTFIVSLFFVQQLEGTTWLFSGCTAAFVLCAALAFNVSGGMTRPSGAFIFSYSCIGILFGIIWKAALGEPAQTNLLQPELTIEVYAASMAAMMAAAFAAQRLRSKRSFLPKFNSLEEMYRGCVGLVICGVLVLTIAYSGAVSATPGSIWALLFQLDTFLPLGIILGVTYEVRRSRGRRSVNSVVLLAILLTFGNGVLGYSKAGMIAPFVCWLIPAAALRYRVSILQMGVLGLCFMFISYYLVPYSQYGRNFKGSAGSLRGDLKNNFLLLSNLPLVRKIYLQDVSELYTDEEVRRYYNKPQSLADRVQMITPDDSIINLTEEGAVFGIFPTIFSFENAIPHFIWHNKPSIGFGNLYAHELGLVADEDFTTGISFSPSGDAYHQAKWVGILVILPLLSLMLFTIADSICGDTRESPFPLLILLIYLHAAPEGGAVQFALLASTGMVQIIFVAFVGARVMPIMASLLLGPAREPIAWVPSMATTQSPVGLASPVGNKVE